jgi:dTDP-4-amino-4,6-dideoxygalactose transaminase
MVIPVCRPLLPPADDLLPYLRRIDRARYYTNHGQLHEELGERLALRFGSNGAGVALASSGTAALAGAVLGLAGRARAARPLCICPAYSFAATAVAAIICGYEPFFADIGAESWAMMPDDVARLPQLREAGVVIAVAPYGRQPDVAAWETFSASCGVPVVIDAAACFDVPGHGGFGCAQVPVVISLHATKTLSTAEGGVVLARDAALLERVRSALNFGFHNSRESIGPSINGKLSEYHAAIGLADLDRWAGKRAGFLRAAADYQAAAKDHGIAPRIFADDRHANPYALFLARDADHGTQVERQLHQSGIDTRKWYGHGLHRQPEFDAFGHTALPVTDDLAARLIGLPLAVDLDPSDIRRIVSAIASV